MQSRAENGKKEPRQTDGLKKGGQMVKLTDEWTDRQTDRRPTDRLNSSSAPFLSKLQG